MRNTLEKENSETADEALIEIYRKLKPGDPASVESATNLINNLLFDDRRYDLAKVGRYKYNLKLALADRIEGLVAKDDVIDPETGEVFVSAGDKIYEETAKAIENAGIVTVDVIKKDEYEEDKTLRIVGNNFVDFNSFEELKDVDVTAVSYTHLTLPTILRV